jgi:hypothetical protein
VILPKYPVYVLSKGRANRVAGLTARFLIGDFVPFRMAVEPQEMDDYARYLRTIGGDPEKILLELPFSNLGEGGTPARNFIWEHSIEQGAERHWILDDNIRDLRRLYAGKRIPCESGVAMRQVEVLTDRYENVPISGMNYQMFVVPESPPFRWNCHVYSCILIQNDIPFRWRLRYNEDTDLCLQVVDAGLCTIQVNAFMADKQPTMKMGGGNTEALYDGTIKDGVATNDATAGRLKMARSLEALWPGLVTTDWRFGRPQHVVDWSQFKTPLRLRDEIDREALKAQGPDEMGMRLRRRGAVDTPTLAKVVEDYEAKHGVWTDRREQA